MYIDMYKINVSPFHIAKTLAIKKSTLKYKFHTFALNSIAIHYPIREKI